ncbi:MAG: helix-turn-helix domain-containing protein [Bacteroidales bacterium]|jgi:AraC-like DNA-binding protein|nr:helix-turn-helix domain-containing protein [Bacteroidales bacterium]
MEVTFHRPKESIRWFVKQYEEIKSSDHEEILEKFIPREDVSLVFHFGTPPFMIDPPIGRLPSYFIAPVTSGSRLMRVNKSSTTFIVTCRPSVLSRIFNLNLDSEKTVYVDLPVDPFKDLMSRLEMYEIVDQWIICFENFIDEYISDAYIPDCIDLFYDKIIDPNFVKGITDIEGEFSVSPRTLQRQFIKRVGTSPKKLERIIRINRIWESINSDMGIDYQNIVFKGKYYDQSHFIRDFKEITGETPERFFKRDLSNVKIMSGKESINQ